MDSDVSFRSLSSAYYLVSQLIDEIKTGSLTNVISFIDRKMVDWNLVLPEYGGAAMHFLAGMENEGFAVAVLRRTLKDGGDPNTRMEDGLTPVHLAAMWGRCRVLEVLLSHGGDPQLVDWTLCLTAEEYALREHQFQAYAVLSTYSVIVDDVERFQKYLSDESSPASSPRAEADLNNPLTSKQDKTLPENDGLYKDNDWLGRTEEHLAVSTKAVDMIREHRRGTRLYEHPETATYRNCWENVLLELPKKRAKESVYESRDELNCNGDISGRRNDLATTGKARMDDSGRRLQPIYEENKDDYVPDGSKYERKKPAKNRSIPKCAEESELYLRGYEEVATYKSVDRCKVSTASSSTPTPTDRSDDMDVHNRVLCKMSRIYLFMLKKRHIFQRIKQS